MREKKGICQLGIVLASTLLFLFSCSDARDQYDRSNATDPSVISNDDSFSTNEIKAADGINKLVSLDQKKLEVEKHAYLDELGLTGSGNPYTTGGKNTAGQLTTFEEDMRIRLNSVMPIDYESGSMAGITMRTTFNEAKNILSSPSVFQTDSGPIYVYKEGIYVFWRDNDPKYPELIWGTNDYRGVLKTETKEFGDLYIGKDISENYGPEAELGKSYLRKLYNVIYKKPADFDCFETKRKDCNIRYFEESAAILLMMPKLIMRVAEDLKEIADIRIVRDDSSGNQDAPFDIIAGTFTIDGKILSLGQTYSDLLSFQERKTDFIDPRIDAMSVRYGDAYTSTTRSNYTREYKIPVDTETLKGFAVSSKFEKPILIDGKQLNIKLDIEAKSLELAAGDLPESTQMTLKIGLDKNLGLKDLQTQFVDDLRAIVTTGLQGLTGEIGYSSTGRNFVQDSDSLDNSIISYDLATNTGRSISYAMDRIQGNLSYIDRGVMDSPMNKLLMNAYFQAQSISKKAPLTGLGNFKLGDKVEFVADSHDKSEEEITLKIGDMEERLGITDDALFKKVPFKGGELLEEIVTVVAPTDFPFSLILNTENIIKGMSFSTSHDKALTLTCGTEVAELSFGDSDRVTVQNLLAITGCNTVNEYSTDGANMLDTIYIPELKVMLNFSNNDFTTVTIYQD